MPGDATIVLWLLPTDTYCPALFVEAGWFSALSKNWVPVQQRVKAAWDVGLAEEGMCRSG